MVMAADDSKSIQEVLSVSILLADRAIRSAHEAESFKIDNSELAHQLTQISDLVRATARLTSTSATVYDRPILRVCVDLSKTLDRALTLARKCRYKKTNVLHHVLSMTTAADFKKLSSLLASSLADMQWVLSIFSPDSESGTIPPIAITDPILAWVWRHIAAVHMGRADAAQDLASLAMGNDRTKKVIVEENGIPPLLKMLKESSNLEARNAAATALCNLADDKGRVGSIVESLGVSIVVKALSEVPMKVQITLVNLVARMSEVDANVQEEFGKENVIRPIVTLLGMDVDLEEFKDASFQKRVNSLHSLVEINKEMMRNGIRKDQKERDAESSPEDKLMLKVSCAAALWKLAKGSLTNSRKITDTKALLVLAKMIEMETGELKMNCLITVMELAAEAERNSDLKRAVFRPSSTAAKAVLDQLLRVINEEKSASLLIPAVKAMGCLASMFSAKEKRIVGSLVVQLGHRNHVVAAEAAKALCKFVREDNYNRKAHAESVIEFGGVGKLMTLVRSKEHGDLHEVVLLCNVAMSAGNNKAVEQARVLSLLEGVARNAVAQNPGLRDLFARAIHHLTIYQAAAGTHSHREDV